MNDPRRLGPYELLQEVGYGGMGSVFAGRRAGPGGFHKRVAIKTIHPHLAKEKAFVDMFLDEARVAAAMQHPNVAQVFELGEADGTYYITMEFLDGQHLGALLGSGELDVRTVARIISLAARGLHHAHEAVDAKGMPLELVHRDVSPQNIFLTYSGHVKVTDFGIARAQGRLLKTTDTGRIKGKCAYMAPEQVTGKNVDHRADIFALGVVAWELLAGHRLFSHESDAETLLSIMQGDLPSLVMNRPDCPQPLVAIVNKALARDREGRFATAREMADALEVYISDSGPPISSDHLAALLAERSPMTATERELSTQSVSDLASGEAETEMAVSTPANESVAPAKSRAPLAAVLLGVAVAIAWASWPTSLAQIHVDSQPSGARVVVNGEPRGATPVVLHDIPHGRHQLALSLEDFEPMEVSFDADRDEVELSYRLRAQAEPEAEPRPEPEAEPEAEPEPDPEPDVESEPDTEPAPVRMMMRTRPRMTETVAAGMVQITPVRDVIREPTGTARLNLITSPWATVRINGRDFGRTPLYQRSVPVGTLRLELRARGEGEIIRRRLTAPADGTLNERFEL